MTNNFRCLEVLRWAPIMSLLLVFDVRVILDIIS